MSNVNNTPIRSGRSARRFGTTGAALVGAALVLAACGGSDTAAPAADPVAETVPATEALSLIHI